MTTRTKVAAVAATAVTLVGAVTVFHAHGGDWEVHNHGTAHGSDWE